MPLALAGFALQSVPHKGSTALSSSLVPFSTERGVTICQCRRVDGWIAERCVSEDLRNPMHAL